jgi:hemoglobin
VTQYRTARRGLLLAALSAGLAACGMGGRHDTGMTMAATPMTLYERLGGKPAIEVVTQTFLENVAADPRINARFAKADVPALKAKLVDQICEATGGPCTYTGRDMRTAHRGMGITEAEFDALGEDLARALDAHNVPEPERDELLGALGGMKADIVGV